MEIPTVGPVASIVAAIVGGAITLALTLYFRKKKRLTFWIVKTEDLTRTLRKHNLFISLKVANRPVSTLNRATVRVRNSGNASIPKFEFTIVIHGDHSLHFVDVQSDNAQLKKDVTITEPSSAMQHDPVYTLNVPFLNPNESFFVEMFFDGEASDCVVNCRVEDVAVKLRHSENEVLDDFGLLGMDVRRSRIAFIVIIVTGVLSLISTFLDLFILR